MPNRKIGGRPEIIDTRLMPCSACGATMRVSVYGPRAKKSQAVAATNCPSCKTNLIWKQMDAFEAALATATMSAPRVVAVAEPVQAPSPPLPESVPAPLPPIIVKIPRVRL